MFKRYKPGSSIDRFETYKLRNRLDEDTANDAVRHCFRYIKRGINCVLIVSDMESVKMIMSIVKQLQFDEFNISKLKTDGVEFDNIEFRVIPKSNEALANLLVDNAKIIQASDGDPKMKKFKKIMGF